MTQNKNSEDTITKGTLEAIAARVVLKVLYTARMGRPDTLDMVVNTVASYTYIYASFD